MSKVTDRELREKYLERQIKYWTAKHEKKPTEKTDYMLKYYEGLTS